MSLRIKVDMKRFDTAMIVYRQASKRDFAYICNRCMYNVLLKTFFLTPGAKVANVKTQSGVYGSAIKFVTKGKKKPKLKLVKAGDYYSKKAFALAFWKRVKKGYSTSAPKGERVPIVRSFVNRRASSTGYIRYGWGKAKKVFDALKSLSGDVKPWRGWNAKRFLTGMRGSGLAAVQGWNPKAIAENGVAGATTVGGAALQRGVNSAARDMMSWAKKVLRKSAKQS
jgi:hypothetical protein